MCTEECLGGKTEGEQGEIRGDRILFVPFHVFSLFFSVPKGYFLSEKVTINS